MIASIEAFELRGSSGVATLLLLTLATAVPVSGKALPLPGSSGAAVKFRCTVCNEFVMNTSSGKLYLLTHDKSW